MIAGPGAAYICDTCLQLCNELLQDPTPFSPRALELASRPPIVVAAPPPTTENKEPIGTGKPNRTIALEIEQKQNGTTIILHQMLYYENYFELHYLWIRPPLPRGFSFIPRLIFLVEDHTGQRWTGDRGGMLMARPDLTDGPENTVYQGNARFRPLPLPETRTLTLRIADPLGAFENPPASPWTFEVTLP
jgi:hypothetical protein